MKEGVTYVLENPKTQQKEKIFVNNFVVAQDYDRNDILSHNQPESFPMDKCAPLTCPEEEFKLFAQKSEEKKEKPSPSSFHTLMRLFVQEIEGTQDEPVRQIFSFF